MKKTRKYLIYIFLILFSLLGSALGYVKFGLPNVGKAPDLTINSNPILVERGRYLANHVTLCMDCHSKRDWSKFSGPLIPQTLGAGGEAFDESVGFPGRVYSPNITPYNLKNWTDGELFRLITTGVGKNGGAIIDIMPYSSFGAMDQADINAIIAYMRTIPPIATQTPKRKLNFPLNFIVNTLPKKPIFNNYHQKVIL